jgi:DNA-directed RNA polymerase specialized sigma24 family protein
MQFKSVPEHALDISNNGAGASSPEAKTVDSENTANEAERGANGAKISAKVDLKSINTLELLPYCYEAHDQDAWTELHRRVGPKISRAVKKQLSIRARAKVTRELVEELVQETWYKIIDHDYRVLKNTYPADGAFYNYVKTTVVSVVTDNFRKREQKIIDRSDTVDNPDKPINLPAPEAKHGVLRDEIEKILHQKFGSEPHFARDLGMFKSYYWQGYSAPRIAQLLFLSAADVANILIRMRNALKRELGGNNQKGTP